MIVNNQHRVLFVIIRLYQHSTRALEVHHRTSAEYLAEGFGSVPFVIAAKIANSWSTDSGHRQ